MKRLIYWCAAGVAAVALTTIVAFLVIALASELPRPPKGFDMRREGIAHGKLQTVEYDSKAAGCKRKMRVYTPPGFSKDRKYPVLYLLHGVASDETSWVKDGAADTILDNLYADRQIVAMIVVMPNGKLLKPGEKSEEREAEFDAFGPDLLDDVIPYVEKHFPVQSDRDHRALAGVSAGAAQVLKFGPTHPEMFAYVGVFIGGLDDCAQFEKKHDEVLKEVGTTKKLKLLWVANGKNDTTYMFCQNTLALLEKYKIPYVYKEGQGYHNWETARNDLFVFAPLLFREAK